MRTTPRLFAAIKTAKYLSAGSPTGLAGLRTHPSPRSALIYAYSSTLEKLKALPEHSVYRTSTEALTKHRLSIIESYTPPGYDEWCQQASEYVEKNRELFKTYGLGAVMQANGKSFLKVKEPAVLPEGEEYFIQQPWIANFDKDVMCEAEFVENVREAGMEYSPDEVDKLRLPPEPQLTSEQIAEIEDKIAGGLIEEVITVAKAEIDLVDAMLKDKVWEDLIETPAEGQWEYHARQAHMPTT